MGEVVGGEYKRMVIQRGLTEDMVLFGSPKRQPSPTKTVTNRRAEIVQPQCGTFNGRGSQTSGVRKPGGAFRQINQKRIKISREESDQAPPGCTISDWGSASLGDQGILRNTYVPGTLCDIPGMQGSQHRKKRNKDL